MFQASHLLLGEFRARGVGFGDEVDRRFHLAERESASEVEDCLDRIKQ